MTANLPRALGRANPVVFTAVAGLAGFSAYFSMYAFRKPFAAATFEAVPGWHFVLDYKIALVLAQVVGYALSKLIGVKVISEIGPAWRGAAILALIGVAWFALVAFALIPAPWNVACLFVNGLPLGMIWGLVFGYMEGRRVSEVLGAILCASFILSSGVVKSVGAWLVHSVRLSEYWMPAAAGALFMPLLVVSVWVLSQLPPPDAMDEAERVRRAPMTATERWDFLKAYAPGIVLLVIAYILLTALRDFRDNFAAELWTALGYGGEAQIFSTAEVPVAVIALGAMAAVIVVRDNLRALMVVHGLVAAGFLLLGVSTLAWQAHLISSVVWMILAGGGSVHSLHALQRRALRPARRLQRPRGDRRLPDLCRGRLRLHRQRRPPALAQFRRGQPRLAAFLHLQRLYDEHRRHGDHPDRGGLLRPRRATAAGPRRARSAGICAVSAIAARPKRLRGATITGT